MPSGEGIKAVRTTFRIFHEIKKIEGPVSISQLSDRLDLPLSTVHSHVSTLVDCEYLVRRGTKYDVGYRSLENGGAQRSQSRLFKFAKPKVDQLAAEFGNVAKLVVLDHGLAAHAYIAKGENAIDTDLHTGIRLHIHSSGSGKALLSTLSDDRVHEILDWREQPQHGPNTITDRDELMAELEETRETGVSFDRGERAQGLREVAAPIPRDDPYPSAAIGVSGTVSQLSGDLFTEEIPERVSNIAETVLIKLRYA